MISRTSLSFNNTDSCCLLRAPNSNAWRPGYNTPALELMTDFQRRPAVSVDATARIDMALEHMIISGVRLLFVTQAKSTLLGSITSYDIQGEKPMLYLQSKDCRIGTCSRSEIMVQDIMTPVSRWRTLNYKNLPDATLADIEQTFNTLAQRYLVVVETPPGQRHAIVRGMFSATDLERALGITIAIGETAKSFSEIERALGG